jgi:hypothetical protein
MPIQNEGVQEGKLLSEQERIAFRMISTGNDLHGKRAIALLAIDEGATQAEAAQQAGLTRGQVKYWLGKFRQVRMQIFPEEILKAEQLEKEPEDIKTGKPKKTKKSKGKKSKKKSDKKKKAKQGKKSKQQKKGAGKKKKSKGKKKKKKAKS